MAWYGIEPTPYTIIYHPILISYVIDVTVEGNNIYNIRVCGFSIAFQIVTTK